MGCAPSRPIPQPRRQNDKPRKYDNSRLSRPFDPNVPLYIPQYNQSSSSRAKSTVRPANPARYGDAYAQLTVRSKQKSSSKAKQSVRPVDPARYGDAYAQLSARSKDNRAQTGRKDQKQSFYKPVTRLNMGCIASRPVRTPTKLRSLAIRIILGLGARLTEILTWLNSCIPSRPVKTYPTLSEPGPHIPVESPPLAKYLCEDQIDRYDWAYTEMCLPKSERMRRRSAPEPLPLSSINGSMPAVDVDNGVRLDLTGDPFLFL
ncbi:MAG: hypothetical protein Q9175_002789 [Cornicularia normoerica]